LALLYEAQGQHADALALMRRATVILRARTAAPLQFGATGRESEQRSNRPYLLTHVDQALHPENGIRRSDGVAEAFEVAQLAQTSGAAKSISRMAARFATGSDDLSRVVRRRQDAIDRLSW
jgi:hypothetical protein